MVINRARLGAMRVSGSFFVHDEDDDDLVGIVFYYQNNKNFYVITVAGRTSGQVTVIQLEMHFYCKQKKLPPIF